MDERYCTNCRAELPAKADACPACGVFAGDVFDGRLPRQGRRRFLVPLMIGLLLGAGAFAFWKFLPPRQEPATRELPSTRVVGDRPGGARRAAGAKINQAEAMRIARRHIVETAGVGADCVAMIGGGFEAGQWIVNAQDRCGEVRLGRYRVDGVSGRVTR